MSVLTSIYGKQFDKFPSKYLTISLLYLYYSSQLQLSYNLRMSVCLCVCMSQNFGAASTGQNSTDLSEIWYTCSLAKYLMWFFSFFLNFDFRVLDITFGSKRG